MPNLTMFLIAVTLPAMLLVADPSKSKTVKSDAEDQKKIFLTIYNSNRALVSEVRTVNLPSGKVHLWFQDVAARIMPQTVAIKQLSGADFRVLEQNYEYDLLSPEKLLEKYIDREVILVRLQEEEDRTVEKRTRARLLSMNNGTVWQVGDQIVVNPPYAYLEFPELPPSLYAKPTLVWLLDSKKGNTTVETSYLTQEINWRADYVFTLNDDDTEGDINGWVTLTNNSGTTYKDARLKLIAGDVNMVREPERAPMMKMARAAESAPQFQEKAFFEYHMYTLQRPATVNDRQQKQVELLRSDDIGIEKQYIVRGERWYFSQKVSGKQTQKTEVVVRLENSKGNGMGMALPKGTVRVYKKDSDGSSQFIGEDAIDHTPVDETIFLKLGNAFDIVTERRQTDYRVLSKCMHESTYEVKIRNHKSEPVRVRVIEPVGGDWEMLSNSHEFTKLDAFTIEFSVPVDPGEEAVLTYRVRVKYC